MDSSGTVLFKRGNHNSDFEEIWDDTALIEAYDKAVSLAKDINEQRKKNSQSESHSECSSTAGIPRTKNLRRRRKGSDRAKGNAECISWFPEDHCRAAYNADGVIYEAEVKSVNSQRKNCVIQFVGYGNEEEVMLNQLQPSFGEQARLVQVEESQAKKTFPQEKYGRNCKGAYPKQKQHARTNVHQNPEQNYSQYQNGLKAEKQQRPSPNILHQHIPGTSSQPCFTQASQFSFPPFAPFIPPMVLPPPPLPLSEDVEEDDEALSSMLMAWYMSGYHTGYYQGLKCGRNRAASSSCYTPRGSGRQSPAYQHKCNKSHP